MKKETARKILSETENGYDLISQKFSQTRKHFWRGLEFIADYAKDGDRVLDYGCGNGRLLELFGAKAIEYYGADVSQGLLDLAKEKYPEKAAAFIKLDPNQNSLPFETDFFNTAYSIAVFHHFPGSDYRESLAKELYRVVTPEGYVVVTVWNLWQQKYYQNILKNWLNKIFGAVIRMSGFRGTGSRFDSRTKDFDWNDCEISFTDNGVYPVKSAQGGAEQFNRVNKIERFHHAFTKRELRKLFEKAGFQTQKCAIIKGRNIIYIGKKKI